MPSKLDIYGEAGSLITRHGAAAAEKAAKKAAALQAKGDIKGSFRWFQIEAAIRDIRSRKPAPAHKF